MLFHRFSPPLELLGEERLEKRAPSESKSFAALGGSQQREGAGQGQVSRDLQGGDEQLQIHPLRLGLALLFLVILIVAAFVGRWLEFEQAATTFLHLSEVAAGGLAGLFFGERLTLADLGRT